MSYRYEDGLNFWSKMAECIFSLSVGLHISYIYFSKKTLRVSLSNASQHLWMASLANRSVKTSMPHPDSNWASNWAPAGTQLTKCPPTLTTTGWANPTGFFLKLKDTGMNLDTLMFAQVMRSFDIIFLMQTHSTTTSTWLHGSRKSPHRNCTFPTGENLLASHQLWI